jgi:molybdopterin-guanine dinucleotide biosynthesis protein A
MGTNKSLLPLGGIKVIERVVKLIGNLFQEVILITNQPEEYSFLNLKMYKDLYKDIGPLAGIHSALVHTSTNKNFIISCDIPLMTSEVIKYIVDYPTTKPITITKADNFVQQLCGVYDKSLIPAIDNIIRKETDVTDERNSDQKKRGCRVLDLVNNTESAIIDIEKEYKDYHPGTFYNMNRPEEYKFIESILQKEL